MGILIHLNNVHLFYLEVAGFQLQNNRFYEANQ